ncbi:hypothetical protein E2C01_017247 [Portunus trituberculatus]|uniref:Uncharacterized protein n=1 Tax=Portunus trituberculatus TaxID=210409 RepID=A0A5B7DRU4_PORTR|nr:hypothetical protein [Portunus trituberculatus]
MTHSLEVKDAGENVEEISHRALDPQGPVGLRHHLRPWHPLTRDARRGESYEQQAVSSSRRKAMVATQRPEGVEIQHR